MLQLAGGQPTSLEPLTEQFSHSVLINGQSGRVEGDYPKSPVRIGMIAFAVLLILALVYWYSSGPHMRADTLPVWEEGQLYDYEIEEGTDGHAARKSRRRYQNGILGSPPDKNLLRIDKQNLRTEMLKIGISITSFAISSFNYPEEVQKMAEKAAAQSMIGDVV